MAEELELGRCDFAGRLFGGEIICGKDCPIFGECPRIIMEDATGDTIDKAMDAMEGAFKKANELQKKRFDAMAWRKDA